MSIVIVKFGLLMMILSISDQANLDVVFLPVDLVWRDIWIVLDVGSNLIALLLLLVGSCLLPCYTFTFLPGFGGLHIASATVVGAERRWSSRVDIRGSVCGDCARSRDFVARRVMVRVGGFIPQ